MLDPNTDDIRSFLSNFWFIEGQFIEIRIIALDGKVTSHFCAELDQAVSVAARASGNANVYIGTCPRFRRRGNRESVRIVQAAWADLDFHQLHADRDVALELAYRRIEAFGLTPTILVNSGNGLQVWWLFHRPTAITDEWPVERFEAINLGIAERIGGDHVQDLARVLRVPGTLNLPTAKKRERGCVPVMARLMDASGPSYSPDDLAPLASHAQPTPRVASISIAQPPEPRTEIIAAFDALLIRLGGAHPLVRTWLGLRFPRDTSRSGWDWALVRELYRTGVREPFIPEIVRAYPHGRGALATDRYILRTMQKARVATRGTHGSEQPLGA